MRVSLLIGVLLVLIMVGCSNSEIDSDSIGSKIEVSVEKVGDTLQPKDIKVKHKQDVKIIVKSDADGTFHIHGYNVEKELVSGEKSEISLISNATGRFPIGFHASDSKSEHAHDHEEHDKCAYKFPVGSPDTPVIKINITQGQNPETLIINPNITNFKLASKPEEEDDHSKHNMDMQENQNIGHWHLYINNELKGMYYDETATIEGLDSGENIIKVVLSSLTHCEYDITAETTIEIEGDLNTHEEYEEHEEQIIGNFIVEPN